MFFVFQKNLKKFVNGHDLFFGQSRSAFFGVSVNCSALFSNQIKSVSHPVSIVLLLVNFFFLLY